LARTGSVRGKVCPCVGCWRLGSWASEEFLPGGSTWRFFQNFSRGDKICEICFFPLETKKTTFFAKIFKIQEGQVPPSDAHGRGLFQCAHLLTVANAAVKLALLILRYAAIKYVFCLRAENRSNLSLPASLSLVRVQSATPRGFLVWKLREAN